MIKQLANQNIKNINSPSKFLRTLNKPTFVLYSNLSNNVGVKQNARITV